MPLLWTSCEARGIRLRLRYSLRLGVRLLLRLRLRPGHSHSSSHGPRVVAVCGVENRPIGVRLGVRVRLAFLCSETKPNNPVQMS